MNAYRLSYEVRQLIDSIGEGGELTPESERILEELSKDSTQLINTLGLAIREHNLSSTALRGEAQWLTQGARRHETSQTNLREYLLRTLKLLGMDKITTDVQKITVSKSPPKVVVEPGTDIELLEERYLTRSVALDDAEVKKALQDGVEIPGLHIEQGEHVRISPR